MRDNPGVLRACALLLLLAACDGTSAPSARRIETAAAPPRAVRPMPRRPRTDEPQPQENPAAPAAVPPREIDDSAVAPRPGAGAPAPATPEERRRAAFARIEDDRTPAAELVPLWEEIGRGVLTDRERDALTRCALRLDVPFDLKLSIREFPPRHARRNMYEALAADAILRDDWTALLARMDVAPTDIERQDIVAGFIVMDASIAPPDPGPAGSPARAEVLARRRANFDRIYRASKEPHSRRRMVQTAFDAFGALARDATAPDEERAASRRLLEDLVAFETDAATRDVLRSALSRIDSPPSGGVWKPPGGL